MWLPSYNTAVDIDRFTPLRAILTWFPSNTQADRKVKVKVKSLCLIKYHAMKTLSYA